MTSREDTPAPGPTPGEAEPGLKFPVTIVDTGAEYPLHTDGHFNFWFRNPHDKPIQLGIFPGRQGKNCDCSSVEAALFAPDSFAPEDWKQLQTDAPVTAVALIGAPAPHGCVANLLEVAPTVAQMTRTHEFLRDKLRWHTLELDDPLTVPGQAVGLVRLTWHGNRTEPSEMNSLWAGLWTKEPDADRPTIGPKLSVRLAFVLPIRIEPTSRTIAVRELSQGEKGDAEFLCWSSTHRQFTIEPVAESEFVTVQKPRPLRPSELDALTTHYKRLIAEQEWRKKNPKGQPHSLSESEIEDLIKGSHIQVLAGYAVTVTVRERLANGKQLDLGPFQSQIHFKGELHGVEIPPVTVTSVIRGEVTVTAPGIRDAAQEQRDRLSLGEFYADRGKELIAKVTADRPGIEVKVVGLEPEDLKKHLEVDLRPVKASAGDDVRVWNLHIQVPPDRLQGRLPPHSVILLETKGTASRRIRIPISGHASVRSR
jgi:hypothetical protein